MLAKKMRAYVNHAFRQVPKGRQAEELKEELYTNLMEKASDLIHEGNSESEAYTIAVSSIGDVTELIESIRQTSPLGQPNFRQRQKRAVLISISICMLVVSPFALLLFLLDYFELGLGLFAMFVLIAAATSILVYTGMTRPRYVHTDDTVVEQFKEYSAKAQKRKALYAAIRVAAWFTTLAVYLMVSFLFNIWAFSWLIFVFILAFDQVANAALQTKGDRHDKKK